MSSCLVQGNCPRISSVSDKNNWKAVMKALSVIGFTEEEVQVIINTKEKKSPTFFHSLMQYLAYQIAHL